MRYAPLGRSGLNVSVVMPCSANVARAERAGDDLQEIVWAIQEAFHTHGFNCFETADAYGLGAAEVILGRALEGMRERIAIIAAHAPRRDVPDPEVSHDASSLELALDETLRRLGTTHVDVYVVRGMDPSVPAQNLGQALEGLRDKGKLRWWGAGLRPDEDLPALAAFPGFTAWETPFNLLEREPKAGLARSCANLGVGLLAQRPLGMGLLGGEYRSRPDFRVNPERSSYPFFSEQGYAAAQHGIAYLRRLAWAHGVEPAAAALAWVLREGAWPVVNWRNPDQLAQAAASTEAQISEHEAERLVEAFATPG